MMVETFYPADRNIDVTEELDAPKNKDFNGSKNNITKFKTVHAAQYAINSIND